MCVCVEGTEKAHERETRRTTAVSPSRAVSLSVASSPSLSLDGVVTVRFDVRLARAARMSTAVWCRNRVEKRNPPSSHRTTARRKTTTISVPSLPSPRQTWWTLIHTHAHVSVSTAVVVAYYLRVVRVVVAARALHEWYHHLCVALRPRTRVFFSILQSRVRNFPFFFSSRHHGSPLGLKFDRSPRGRSVYYYIMCT